MSILLLVGVLLVRTFFYFLLLPFLLIALFKIASRILEQNLSAVIEWGNCADWEEREQVKMALEVGQSSD